MPSLWITVISDSCKGKHTQTYFHYFRSKWKQNLGCMSWNKLNPLCYRLHYICDTSIIPSVYYGLLFHHVSWWPSVWSKDSITKYCYSDHLTYLVYFVFLQSITIRTYYKFKSNRLSLLLLLLLLTHQLLIGWVRQQKFKNASYSLYKPPISVIVNFKFAEFMERHILVKAWFWFSDGVSLRINVGCTLYSFSHINRLKEMVSIIYLAHLPYFPNKT